MTTTPPLLTPPELADWLDSDRPAPVLLDVRWALGRSAEDSRALYAEGHLPGAAFIDLDAALSGPKAADGAGGRHPMPDAARFEAAIQAAGVCADSSVVVYDDGPGLGAARCWWLLQYFGHESVQVLSGGYAAWQAAGLQTEAGVVEPTAGTFSAEPGGRTLLAADDIPGYLERGTVVDARPADRFAGQNETVDPVAGHIPGAISVPALALLGPDKTFLDTAALQEAFAAVPRDGEVAVYCGSGVQACHVALAHAVAHPGARPLDVYIGSWSDWITDPSRPVTKG